MITGSDIRAARERAGESQEQFARRFDVNQATVARWEKSGPPARGPARRAIESALAEIGVGPREAAE